DTQMETPAVLPPDTHIPERGRSRLSFRAALVVRIVLLRRSVQEYLVFDSWLFRTLAGYFGCVAVWLLGACGRTRQSFNLLCKLHRANFLKAANARAEDLAREAATASVASPVRQIYTAHIEQIRPTSRTARFFEAPERLLGSLVLVLK